MGDRDAERHADAAAEHAAAACPRDIGEIRRIRALPVAVVNRIAAGEVVERPASVVKELLENAIDSAPRRIDVVVEQGGIALVRVMDDGCGIDAEDLPLAVAPHATSKLRTAEDLEQIATLGFRGEALASIAAVSRLVIRSRTAAGRGSMLEVDGGVTAGVRPEGCGVGTTVEVHQLFGRIPARRAFLRAAATEWSHASDAFVRTALAHPEITFSLTHNGRLIHELPSTRQWRQRIADLFGSRVAERLIEVREDDITDLGTLSLEAFVGRPEDDLASGRLQHFFVGRRPFRDRAVLHAVQEAYRGLLLTGRQPIVFLRLGLPPESVDVNVHPAKQEVRFRDPARVHRLVVGSIRRTFLAGDLQTGLVPPTSGAALGSRTDAITAPASLPAWRSPEAWRSGRDAVVGEAAALGSPSVPAADPSSSAMPQLPWERDVNPGQPAYAGQCRPAGRAVQMHDRYIVVEREDGIEVIDQHALHERLLYEQFKDRLAAGTLEVQPLLIPQRVDLPPVEFELVTEHAATLARAGMRVEPFGGTTVLVSSRPALAGGTAADELLREVVDRLAARAAAGGDGGLMVDEVLHGLACRAAIKAGDPLSQEEVDTLVQERYLVPESHHCPHGRPTSLLLSRQDLDRQFRRI